ncbi:MAG: DUF2318 domain-containing protein [Candidatus Hodarchaeota archaeon]
MKQNDNQKIIHKESLELKEDQREESWSFFKAIILISIVSFAAIIFLQGNNNPRNQFLIPQQEGDNLILSLSSLNTNAKFYRYRLDDVNIDFFAVIGSDVQPHIAFDACDVCYSEKKGYEQNDNMMVCKNCGNQFFIDSIGTENQQGGCWPSYLPVTIVNGEAHIKISDVAQKKYMFA